MQAQLLSFFVLLGLASAQNITSSSSFTLPAGYTNHGNPNLLCHSAQWSDYLSFYIENYVTHAATLIGEPGQSLSTWVLSMIMALLFPSYGVCRALDSILNLPLIKGRTDLQVAARAGALFQIVEDETLVSHDDVKEKAHAVPDQAQTKPAVVVSSPSRPSFETRDRNPENRNPTVQKYVNWLNIPKTDRNGFVRYLPPRGYERITIHGCADLPPGFALERVPPRAGFQNDEPPESLWEESKHRNLLFSPAVFLYLALKKAWTNAIQRGAPKESAVACSYNTIGILVAILQLMFSAVTYYRSRGDQVDRYGYAAFGFTVVPYTLMTLINLIGNLVCPSYDAVYLVANQCLRDLQEALKQMGMSEQYPLDPRGNLLEPTNRSLTRWQALISGSPLGRWKDQYDEIMPQLSWATFLTGIVGVCVGLLPLVVIGAVSRFRTGSSTHAQRSWIMTWLVLGGSVGGSAYLVLGRSARINELRRAGDVGRAGLTLFQALLLMVVYAAPAIGMFCVVGQMLSSYGICETLA